MPNVTSSQMKQDLAGLPVQSVLYQENSEYNNIKKSSFFGRLTQKIQNVASWGISKNPFYGTDIHVPNRYVMDRDTMAEKTTYTDAQIDELMPSYCAQKSLKLEAYKYNNNAVGNYFSKKLIQAFAGVLNFELALWGIPNLLAYSGVLGFKFVQWSTATSLLASYTSTEICSPARDSMMLPAVAADQALIPLVCEPVADSVADAFYTYVTVNRLIFLGYAIALIKLGILANDCHKKEKDSDISIINFTKENIDIIMVKYLKLRRRDRELTVHKNQRCPLSNRKLKKIKHKVIYENEVFCYDTLKDKMANDPLGTIINGEGILNIKLTRVFRVSNKKIRYRKN